MIIESQKSNNVQVIGEDTSKSAKIDETRLKKLSYILTEGLYLDPQSATIVELTNNAMDSIIESGKDPIENPVFVNLYKEATGYKLSIKDNGLGMSKTFFEGSFMKVLFSTKEENDDVIGHFGIGGKSWASLKKTVTFTVVQDGIKCKYLCWKGEEFIDYDLLTEEPTEEGNGVLFELPIGDYWEYEAFKTKAKQKLAYYDTVVLTIDGKVWNNKIYRTDLFQWSSNKPYTMLHICLKDVVYTLDYTKLGINQINLPIALRFNLTDGIIPTPNRENIIMNKETIELIKDRIKKVATYMVERYNEEVEEFEHIIAAWKYIDSYEKYVHILGEKMNLNAISGHTTVRIANIKVKGCKHLTPTLYKQNYSLFTRGWVVAAYKNFGRLTKGNEHLVGALEDVSKGCIIGNVNVSGFFRDYLKAKSKYEYFLKPNPLAEPVTLKLYRRVLGLTKHNKAVWREIIKEWQDMQKRSFASFADQTNLHLSQEFLDWREAERSKPGTRKTSSKKLVKQADEMTIAYARPSHTGYGYVFEKKVFNPDFLGKQPFMTIIMDEADKEKIGSWAPIFKKQKVKFCLIGKKEMTRIPKKLHNFMTLKQVEASKAFSRVTTAIRGLKALEIWEKLARNRSETVLAILKKAESLKAIVNVYVSRNVGEAPDDLQLQYQMMAAAQTGNLWDTNIIDKIIALEKFTEEYKFISIFRDPEDVDPKNVEDFNQTINNFLLFRKMRYPDRYPNLQICIGEVTDEQQLINQAEQVTF